MKNICTAFLLLLISSSVFCQMVNNTSYKNQSGEKILRLETILPVDISTAWQLFTTDEKLKKWLAPVAHIELKTGGYILTNYDNTKKLTDSTSIRLPIINFIPNELLTLKVNLNNNFPKAARDADENLQQIIQLKEVDSKHTRIIVSMVGFGVGPDWDETYNFFSKGNEWTFKELINLFKN